MVYSSGAASTGPPSDATCGELAGAGRVGLHADAGVADGAGTIGAARAAAGDRHRALERDVVAGHAALAADRAVVVGLGRRGADAAGRAVGGGTVRALALAV